MDRRAPHRSLSPTLIHRITVLSRPAWARTIIARRVAAAALVALAVALFFRGDPRSQLTPTVVAAHDLQPGRIVTADDIRIAEYSSGIHPEGAASSMDAVVGKTVAGATRRGEPITDARVLGPRLAAVSVGTTESRVVPLRLADAGVAELLREGDRVDIFTAAEHADPAAPNGPTMIAADAAVVLVSPTDSGRGAKERVVMVALPTGDAGKVAAASLTSALTVTFH
ncbi:SAF domain-containing protein [Antrihabitans cavernicola]|uniref:Flagellar biosynthesis protein FlgA n=1 Tax=Antrihabitans cavernicola TaxID=2495913 RepID=A0A5A7SGH4_9NOCA|nr:SAF domain-containing protein [Spelaeibacter cavernicola]KAA0023787.1 flagellar biosynthesis protein FlgA [Spelaeibacter cavernicola]